MNEQHDWIWHELMTTDLPAAVKFYGDVVGWEMKQYPAPPEAPPYWVGHASGRGVVGLMGMPPGVPAHVRPNWSGYVHTGDVDATAQAIIEAGGSVLRAPFDIPGVGRIAVVADPQRGVFDLMQPEPREAPPKLEQNTPGNVSWCELHSDTEDNFDFYQKLFGWQKTDAVDMGEFGKYQMFKTNENPATGGSMRRNGGADAATQTFWLFYFSVDGIEAAISRVKDAGGNVFMGPHEVPGGTWIALGNDPQGTLFALHSQTK